MRRNRQIYRNPAANNWNKLIGCLAQLLHQFAKWKHFPSIQETEPEKRDSDLEKLLGYWELLKNSKTKVKAREYLLFALNKFEPALLRDILFSR